MKEVLYLENGIWFWQLCPTELAFWMKMGTLSMQIQLVWKASFYWKGITWKPLHGVFAENYNYKKGLPVFGFEFTIKDIQFMRD